MRVPKVGDRAKIVQYGSGYSHRVTGHIGSITKVTPRLAYIQLDYNKSTIWSIKHEYLEFLLTTNKIGGKLL